jgi:Tol biopolymer transport system component
MIATRFALALASVLAGGLLAGLAAPSPAAAGLHLVSANATGVFANADSEAEVGGSVSGNGRFVAFESEATNLDGSAADRQAYVKDLATGKVRRVSKAKNGDPADQRVFDPTISADGRFVTYTVSASNLPGGDGNINQVYLYDRETRKTRLVSRGSHGAGDDHSGYSAISAHGRFVEFSSYAGNLPGGKEPESVYVRDVKRGKTILVSRNNAGELVEGSEEGQSISASGRLALFESDDPDLPGGGIHEHIYVRDLRKGTTTLVDRNTAGKIASDSSWYPSISGNGRFVGFYGDGGNLPGGGTHSQAYLRDLKRGSTKLASRNNAGAPQDGNTVLYVKASNDGRFVTFEADGANLPGGDGTRQVYVRDMVRGKTKLLSRAGGTPGDGDSGNPSMSANGRWVIFRSYASNLGGNPFMHNVFRAGPFG